MSFTIVNNVTATVATQSNSGTTSLVVGSGLGVQFSSATTTNPIRCGAFDSTGALKFYFDVTAVATDTLTVANRGAESTSDANILTTDVVAAVVTQQGLYAAVPGLWCPPLNRLLAASYDPALTSTSSAPADNTVRLSRIPIPSTITASNLLVGVSSAQGATPRAAMNWVGLYDSTGTRIASSADLSGSSPFLSTGLKTIAFASSVTIVGGPGVFVWGAVTNNETGSAPQFGSRAAVNAAAGVDANVNLTATVGLGSAKWLGSGTLPSSITLSTMTAEIPQIWMALT